MTTETIETQTTESIETGAVDATELSNAITNAFKHTPLSRKQAHEKVLQIAADLADKITKDEAGKFGIDSDNIMGDYLPDGVTTEHLKAGDETQRLVLAGIHRAYGQQAIAAMTEDASLEKTVGEFTLRPGVTATDTIKRQETYPGMVRDGVKLPDTVTHGASRVVVKSTAAETSAGEVAASRSWVNEIAQEAFKAL